jgi:hypothetical protein
MSELEEGDDGYEEQMDGQENLFPLDPEAEDPDVNDAGDTGGSTTDEPQ